MESMEEFEKEFHAYRKEHKSEHANHIVEDIVEELRCFLYANDDANYLWENCIVPDEWGEQ